MKKAFEIAGYGESEIKTKFSALFEAFHYGVPPHGGCAPGLDRIIMLLSDNENIREVIAFPFNQRAQDLMMNAPVNIDSKQLKELNLKKIRRLALSIFSTSSIVKFSPSYSGGIL